MLSFNDFPIKKLFSFWCRQKNLSIKEHQLKGIEWVINRERQPELGSAGGFVCDEMGLGKTILMIGATVINPKSNTLVVMPKSLLEQWRNAITSFTALDEKDVFVNNIINIWVTPIGTDYFMKPYLLEYFRHF